MRAIQALAVAVSVRCAIALGEAAATPEFADRVLAARDRLHAFVGQRPAPGPARALDKALAPVARAHIDHREPLGTSE